MIEIKVEEPLRLSAVPIHTSRSHYLL